MTAPTVTATTYTVSLLPFDNINASTFAITVEQRSEGRWAVTRHRMCLGVDGAWDWESTPSERADEWLAAHRFDLDTAIDLACKAAPDVCVNGWTARELAAGLASQAGAR